MLIMLGIFFGLASVVFVKFVKFMCYLRKNYKVFEKYVHYCNTQTNVDAVLTDKL